MKKVTVGTGKDQHELRIWVHRLVTKTRTGVVIESVSFYAQSHGSHKPGFGKVLIGWYRSMYGACAPEELVLVGNRQDVDLACYDDLHQALEAEKWLFRTSTGEIKQRAA